MAKSKNAAIQLIKVGIELRGNDARMPTYGSEEAAGCDLYSTDPTFELKPGQWKMVSTGIHMVIPEGYEAQCRPRSGLAAKHGLTILNAPGTIDSDYRGECKVILMNLSDVSYFVETGERVGQLVFAPVLRADFEAVPSVDDYQTERGAGGFGSTGKL